MDILVLVLATWRISTMFSKEDGPFKMFARLRSIKGLGDLFDCFWCVSVWVAAFTALIAHLGGTWLLVPFAISRVVITLESASV